MSRVKGGPKLHWKHKKLLKLAKGYYGRRKNNITTANKAVTKSMTQKYESNKLNKRYNKKTMIKYLNKHANEYSLSYKWIVNGIHALNLNLSLPTLTEMVKSRVYFSVLLDLFMSLKKC